MNSLKFRSKNKIIMQNKVVGIGEVLWDVLPEDKKLGGAPANFAYHVGQFGLESCVVSAVGNDLLGSEIEASFDANGLNYQLACVAYPTGTVEVELDAAGIPRYDIKENVAWDHIPFTEMLGSLAGQTRAVCFGSLAQRCDDSRATIARFLDAVAAGGDALIVFDVNLRQQFWSEAVLRDSMTRCNVLKINDEELVEVGLMFGLGEMEPERACRSLMERLGLEILILTCGIAGSYVFTREATSFQPTPAVVVADTVGAGDSFTAAFIASLLRGATVTDAHATAVATSAFVCTQAGAMPKLPAEIIGQ